MQYRQDIDGLRAIAVSVIVLFHFGLHELGGGFVGVDVFFVISGYLITAITLRDISTGRFGFGRFYMRRLRRLGPALGVTLLATLAMGVWLLSAQHLLSLADQTAATLFSVSNIHFWNTTGYFDLDARYKPLLHTWSLAVEEQFYLVWPVVLLGLFKLAPRQRLQAVIALGVIGLVISEVMLNIDAAAAFFLPVARLHEFAIGGALAVWGRTLDRGGVANAVSAAGVVLILGASVLFTETMRFPGLAALVPALGAGLLIVAGPQAFFNRRILSLAPVVYIGRISYSLYLVHWPIIVYYAYRFGMPDDLLEVAGLTAFGIALAALMYHFVETPFRRTAPGGGFDVPNAGLRTRTAWTAGVLILGCGAIMLTKGLPGRLSPEVTAMIGRFEDARTDRFHAIRRDTCHVTAKSDKTAAQLITSCLPPSVDGAVIVMGDSHAADVWAALHRLYPDQTLIQITGAGCSLSQPVGTRAYCDDMYDWARDWIGTHADQLRGIVYTERAAGLITGDPAATRSDLPPNARAIDGLFSGLDRVAAGAVPVVLFGPRAEFHPEPELVLLQTRSLDRAVERYGSWDISAYRRLDATLAARAEAAGLGYVSSLNAVCAEQCRLFFEDGRPLLTDYGHWSTDGGVAIMAAVLQDSPLPFLPDRAAQDHGG